MSCSSAHDSINDLMHKCMTISGSVGLAYHFPMKHDDGVVQDIMTEHLKYLCNTYDVETENIPFSSFVINLLMKNKIFK